MPRGSNRPGKLPHGEVKDMLLKRGFAVKESEECGTNGTMAMLTLSNPEEALGALAVYALEGYKSKNDTGMGVSCSSGMGAGKI